MALSDQVLDFQSTKTRSLDSVTFKLIHETDDAKLANAAASSSSAASTASLQAEGGVASVVDFDGEKVETGSEAEKEAWSPTKKTQGFFDDLQSKFQQKSKELQVSLSTTGCKLCYVEKFVRT